MNDQQPVKRTQFFYFLEALGFSLPKRKKGKKKKKPTNQKNTKHHKSRAGRAVSLTAHSPALPDGAEVLCADN